VETHAAMNPSPPKRTSGRKGHTGTSPLTVIVPIYNEALTLPNLMPGLVKTCSKHNWRLILVDDGSQDGTREILSQYKQKAYISIIHHKLNRGYGGAIKTGIVAAETPYIVTIDADGQHQVSDIEKLLDFSFETSADMVIGRRDKRASGWFRELGKSVIRGFARLLMPLPIHDLNSGFKLYRTDLAKRYAHLCPDTMAYSDVMTLVFINQRHLVRELPITVQRRNTGRSTINVQTAFDTFLEILHIVMLFNPLRVFLPLAFIFVISGLLWGFPLVLLGRGVSVGAMLAIVVGVIFFFLGLIASQLSAIRLGKLASEFYESLDRSKSP
jgi:glycosyltransferase involved in cell wall biosynthesis